MDITREIAIKVRDTVAAGLVSGVGIAEPGKMCVEAAVCYALGLPHGDDPGCVSPALRVLKIALNDAAWSSEAARAHGLRRLALAQLGSRGALDDVVFAQRVAEMTIRRMVPIALRAAALFEAQPHASELEASAVLCEQQGTAASAASAESAASAASAARAAWAASDESAESAESAESDHVLMVFAEYVVEILIDMGAPGCQWLDLVPVEAA